jgi:hypothetical protein
VYSEHIFIHMEANVRFAAKSDNPADLQLLLQQTHDEVSQIFPTDKRNFNRKLCLCKDMSTITFRFEVLAVLTKG